MLQALDNIHLTALQRFESRCVSFEFMIFQQMSKRLSPNVEAPKHGNKGASQYMSNFAYDQTDQRVDYNKYWVDWILEQMQNLLISPLNHLN